MCLKRNGCLKSQNLSERWFVSSLWLLFVFCFLFVMHVSVRKLIRGISLHFKSYFISCNCISLVFPPHFPQQTLVSLWILRLSFRMLKVLNRYEIITVLIMYMMLYTIFSFQSLDVMKYHCAVQFYKYSRFIFFVWTRNML